MSTKRFHISPNPELKRRTQQYGHLFSYRYRYSLHVLYRSTQWRLTAFVNRKVLEKYGPLPDFTHAVVTRIMENKLMPKEPDHLLVNEYNAGQGIMPHTGMCVTNANMGIHDLTLLLDRCSCTFWSCHPILVITISLCNEVHACGNRRFNRHFITYVYIIH